MAGLLVFVAGSILAATAGAAGPLIWARVVQGVGGSCILPGTLSTVNATFRGRDRAFAFGVWGAVISGAAAPLLGGWLTSTFSWPSIFWINVPIGAAVLAGALLAVPESRGAPGGRGADVDGLQLSAIGLGALVFAVIEGSDLGWWRPLRDFTVLGFTWPAAWPVSVIPVLVVVALASLTLFVVWERHRARAGRSAILYLALFRLPTFSWGNITVATVAIGEFAIVFVLPLYLVNGLGLGIMGAGLILAAMAAGAFASGASARRLAARFGPPAVVLIGLALEITGVCAVALALSADVSPWLVAALLIIYGVGLGLASAQLTSTVLQDVPAAVSGQGSATQSTVRQVGAAIGAAISGAALSIGLGRTMAAALTAVPGLPPAQASHLAESTRSSAGAIINVLRGQGITSQFRDLTPRWCTPCRRGSATPPAGHCSQWQRSSCSAWPAPPGCWSPPAPDGRQPDTPSRRRDERQHRGGQPGGTMPGAHDAADQVREHRHQRDHEGTAIGLGHRCLRGWAWPVPGSGRGAPGPACPG